MELQEKTRFLPNSFTTRGRIKINGCLRIEAIVDIDPRLSADTTKRHASR